MSQDKAGSEVTSEQIQRGTQAAIQAIQGFKSHGTEVFEEGSLRGATEILLKMDTDRALLELIYSRQVRVTYEDGEMVVSLTEIPTNCKGTSVTPEHISPAMARWARVYGGALNSVLTAQIELGKLGVHCPWVPTPDDERNVAGFKMRLALTAA
jgi:hypothetical protein